MTCPVCGVTAEPAVVVASVAICSGCGFSLVVEADGVRRAMGADTTSLSAADLQTLRASRKRQR